jgi:undecaprenyl diphosphate synthase
MKKGSNTKNPEHIGIIMDGNGRWAQKRALPRIKGHERGTKTVEKIIDGCLEFEIPYLTLYAFSSENWNRPQKEIDHLMHYLSCYLDDKLDDLIKKEIRFNAIGRIYQLPNDIQKKIQRNKEQTQNNDKLVLTLALSYSGRTDIVDAVCTIVEDIRNKKIDSGSINEKLLSASLSTHGLPDLDLMIRTSGELRMSNFMLWEAAYAEFYFTPVLWPDFKVSDLQKAIDVYKKRNRRFGKI